PRKTMAWFERFSPTAGKSARTAIPRSRSAAAAPIPARIRKAGEWTPPSATMIFMGEKFLLLGADPGAHAGNASAVEHKPGHECIAGDAEIAAAPNLGIEITNRC